MKELKKSANWYIAATHYLTAGFVVPFIISLIAVSIITFLKITSEPLLVTIRILVYLLSLWLGVLYAARYLRKTYVITDKDKIISLATTYFVILQLGPIAVAFITGYISSVGAMVTFLCFAVGALLFYTFSKKYIQNTVFPAQPLG